MKLTFHRVNKMNYLYQGCIVAYLVVGVFLPWYSYSLKIIYKIFDNKVANSVS